MTDNDSVADILDRISELRKEIKTREEEIKRLNGELEKYVSIGDYMDITTSDGRRLRATYTRNSKRIVDLPRLATMVPADVFDRITHTVLNTELFDQAVETGEISPDAIKTTVTYTYRSPYVRFNRQP